MHLHALARSLHLSAVSFVSDVIIFYNCCKMIEICLLWCL
uniref:Uncharacterized protein n=1 Tax=Anguilla anguilla TaxID=7936 RepID=A0A0E9Q145_ANGAN